MNINNLNKKELLDLKSNIDKKIQELDDNHKSQIEKSYSRKSLSELKLNDIIFCIHYNKNEIYHIDYVKILFTKNKKLDYYNFSTSHESLPLGCSSGVDNEVMNNYCFLSEFLSSFYFFTLKPETWEEDLKIELEKNIKKTKQNFQKELNKTKQNAKGILKLKKDVNEQIEKIKIKENINKFNL